MTRTFSAKIIQGRWFKYPAAIAFSVLALRPASAPSGLAPLVRAYRSAPTPAKRAAIQTYATAHPAERPLAQLALGVAAYEQKDYAAAISALDGVSSKLLAIADYPAYYLGASRVASNVFDNVPQDLAPVHAGTTSPLAGKAWIAEGRALENTAPAQAVSTLRDHYKELPQPDGDLTLADSYRATNDSAQAAEFYQRVYAQYPIGPAADQASAALTALAASMGADFPQPLPEQLLLRADRLYQSQAYAQARTQYETASATLTGLRRDQARVRMGACDLASNNPSAAYAYLSALVIDDPESTEADAERLYDMEEAARRMSNDDAAAAAVRRLDEKHAKSRWRARALYSLGNRYLLDNRAEQFVPLYKSVYSDFPGDGNAATSHWKVAFHAYFRDEGDAEGLLRTHLENYPAHATAGAALYFLGRFYERKGNEAAARNCYQAVLAHFPNAYYAMLSRDRLAVPAVANAAAGTEAANTAAFLANLHFAQPAPLPSQPTAATTLRIDRSRILRSAGLADLADAELRFGARNDAQPPLIALELASQADAPYLGLQSMKAFGGEYLNRTLAEAPRPFWEYLFPLPYRDPLTADAKAHNLDPFLVAGLIRQESEFNPGAVSPAKADGLMQVRYGTAREIARAAGIPRLAPAMLFQPATNLKLGTAIFRSMLDSNGGILERTLAAYNAGPRHASDWWGWNSYREPAEFVETIPFTETRDYVQAVIRNGDIYRRLYAAK